MMKILILGQNAKGLENLVKSLRLEVVSSNPDLIISFGGDGTLLSAEREYPGIPKLPIRNSQFCKKCPKHEDEIILKKLINNELTPEEYKKLETEVIYEQVRAFGTKKFYALNDFVVRNSDPTHTIRFRTSNAGDKLLIGDGIVISTPFGSTGYFKSITRQTFNKGFGVAFNNPTEKIDPLLLKDEDSVRFSLIRGKAALSFDNSPDIFNIDEGSQLIFKLSDQFAKIYDDTSLRCPNCKVIRN